MLDLICRLLKCTKGLWPDAFSVLWALAEPCQQATTLKANFGLCILQEVHACSALKPFTVRVNATFGFPPLNISFIIA